MLLNRAVEEVSLTISIAITQSTSSREVDHDNVTSIGVGLLMTTDDKGGGGVKRASNLIKKC